MLKLKGSCPECDQQLAFEDNLMAMEMKICPGCQNMLVVESLNQGQVIMQLAPQVEEDWGQ